ncbi:MAG: glycosyltransferase family 2 protein [Fimbriimonadaceae bacterium]|nr:glycosyltransferase family 2 protein [Fimbriimonadaceae bacterium]
MAVGTALAPRVSVLIVNYNTRDALERCLGCLEPRHEVIVVDNGSKDDSVAMVRAKFPHVRLIEAGRNLGFGAANNVAAEAARGEYLLYLNSDAYAEQGAVDRLADVLAVRPDLVAVGGMLLNPDGSLQASTAWELTVWAVVCEQFMWEKLPGFGLRSAPWRPYWNTETLRLAGGVQATTQVMGACLMTRDRAARWDERFFLYCEDTDFCRRLSAQGRIAYVPDARFTHDLGTSSRSRWTAVARYNAGKELYFAIHHGRAAAIVVWGLNRLGALLRLLIWTAATAFTLGLVARFRRQVGLFARVLFAPRNGPARPTD